MGSQLTIDDEGYWVAGLGCEDVLGDACVVAGVGQSGGGDNQVTLAGHDEVVVLGRVDTHSVLHPVYLQQTTDSL